MENTLKVLETQRIVLYFKAMKIFSGSKKQEKIIKQIEEITEKIKKIKKKLEKNL